MITSTAWYNPHEIKLYLILVPNLVAFISQKYKNVWFFDYHLQTCSVRKMVFICLMQNISISLLYKSHQIARLVSHLINHFSKWMFTVWQENATKFGSTNEILHIFSYNLVISYGYIIVKSCMLSFNLNCIMLLKQSYNIASKVSSRKKVLLLLVIYLTADGTFDVWWPESVCQQH